MIVLYSKQRIAIFGGERIKKGGGWNFFDEGEVASMRYCSLLSLLFLCSCFMVWKFKSP